jgi:hypothetical protein
VSLFSAGVDTKIIPSTCGFALAILLAATAASAQNPAAPPAAAFEVASVRPSHPNPVPANPLSQIGLMLPQPGGRFTATNTPLRMLIMAAYELKQDAQLTGGPLNLMMRGDGQEMKQIVEILESFTGRAVRDKTGLTGRYDFAMRLDLQMMLALAQKMGANIPAAAANIPQSDGSSLMTALNEQLGLKLESTRDGVTVVVIDSVEAALED